MLILSIIVAILALFSGPFYATLFPSQAVKEEQAILGSFTEANPRVKDVQRMLRDLGYRVGFLDGQISKGLRIAIKDFQKKNNLGVNGRVDSNTFKEMQSRSGQHKITQQNIAKSAKGRKPYQDIKKVQSLLKTAGYYSGDIDGRMGTQTIDAIKKFQQDNDLKPDGVMGSRTWRKLKKVEGR